ncbi:response regulator [Pseudonocardia sichuanensis]|uniref:LuxR family two component transcriptional regulator n=1 Tax=Pseudonocardia kunmingensis TaxID=630975 RepID=A0A543D944_9PSEU|nr:response regulator transcription factor [Pseudonocardia kunmingensis]TQM05864.1 LuxR family two component transcriptional regulator [Pseudonocardia kunmingensis]
MTGPVRILVVDDHPTFRLGMQALLNSIAGFTVVGEAADAPEAVELARRVPADVVVMDLDLAGTSGVDATHAVLRERPELRVLVVTMLEDDDSVFAAMRAGARGYLLKSATPAEVERAVRAVANGEVLVAGGVAERVLGFVTGARRAATPFPELTEREREVLDLVARGMDNLAVARRLALSDKTVRNHLSTILAKLRVADRAQAIVRARDAGLGGAR